MMFYNYYFSVMVLFHVLYFINFDLIKRLYFWSYLALLVFKSLKALNFDCEINYLKLN